MSAKRFKRRIVVVICAVVRSARRVRSALAPRAQAVLAIVVRVSGCSGTDAEVVAAHVVLAALGAGALALAAALTGPGHSHALQVAGVLGVSAIALHAVFIVARRHRGVRSPLHLGAHRALRPLTLSALDRLALQDQVTSARVLAVVCEPRRLWDELPRPGAALDFVLRSSSGLVLSRLKRVAPGMGPALDVIEAYQTALVSARFVRDLALAASHIDHQQLAA